MSSTPGPDGGCLQPAPARPSQLVALGSRALSAAGTASPTMEARTLLAHVLGLEPSRLVMAPVVGAEEQHRYRELLQRRAEGVPVQHLTGEAHFRTVRLQVGPGVFTPRPETEVMTGWVLDRLAGLRADGVERPVVVELCAGSGAISRALAAEAPGLEQHAVELDPVAFGYAARNLEGTGVHLVQGDMATAFGELDGRVDVVVANPPYVPLEEPGGGAQVTDEVRRHDPALALWSGADGLDATRVVARVAARLLRTGGWLASEHAEVHRDSAPAVLLAPSADGQPLFDEVADHDDLTGRARFVTGRRR